jgi:hypothetical protein
MWQTNVSNNERCAVQRSLPDDGGNQISPYVVEVWPTPTQMQILSTVPVRADLERDQPHSALCEEQQAQQEQVTHVSDNDGRDRLSRREIDEHKIACWFLKGIKSYQPEWCLPFDSLPAEQASKRNSSRPTWSTARFDESLYQNNPENYERLSPIRSSTALKSTPQVEPAI